MTREEFNKACLNFKRQHGHAAMRDLLLQHAGTPALSEVSEADFDAVIAAMKKGSTAKPAQTGAAKSWDDIARRAYHKFNKEYKLPDRSGGAS